MTTAPLPRPRTCSGYTLLLEPGHRVRVCSCHWWKPVARPSLRVVEVTA